MDEFDKNELINFETETGTEIDVRYELNNIRNIFNYLKKYIKHSNSCYEFQLENTCFPIEIDNSTFILKLKEYSCDPNSHRNISMSIDETNNDQIADEIINFMGNIIKFCDDHNIKLEEKLLEKM